MIEIPENTTRAYNVAIAFATPTGMLYLYVDYNGTPLEFRNFLVKAKKVVRVDAVEPNVDFEEKSDAE